MMASTLAGNRRYNHSYSCRSTFCPFFAPTFGHLCKGTSNRTRKAIYLVVQVREPNIKGARQLSKAGLGSSLGGLQLGVDFLAGWRHSHFLI